MADNHVKWLRERLDKVLMENATLRGRIVSLEAERDAALRDLDGALTERSQYALYPQPVTH